MKKLVALILVLFAIAYLSPWLLFQIKGLLVLLLIIFVLVKIL